MLCDAVREFFWCGELQPLFLEKYYLGLVVVGFVGT
jgi:hypothetical protein